MKNEEKIAALWVKEMMKGYTKLAMLMLLNRKPLTGYAVMREIERETLGFWRLTPGGAYPALKELEIKGYIEGRWENKGGRRKKIYMITEEGKRVLEATLKKQQQMADAVGELFRQLAKDILAVELPSPPKIIGFLPLKSLEGKPVDEQIRILKEVRTRLNKAVKLINEKMEQLKASKRMQSEAKRREDFGG